MKRVQMRKYIISAILALSLVAATAATAATAMPAPLVTIVATFKCDPRPSLDGSPSYRHVIWHLHNETVGNLAIKWFLSQPDNSNPLLPYIPANGETTADQIVNPIHEGTTFTASAQMAVEWGSGDKLVQQSVLVPRCHHHPPETTTTGVSTTTIPKTTTTGINTTTTHIDTTTTGVSTTTTKPPLPPTGSSTGWLAALGILLLGGGSFILSILRRKSANDLI
jgi:LPXTG-motif cell wall-anchored protein